MRGVPEDVVEEIGEGRKGVIIAGGQVVVGPVTAVGTNGIGTLRLVYDGLDDSPGTAYGLGSLDLSTASALEVDVIAVGGTPAIGLTLFTDSASNQAFRPTFVNVSGPGTTRIEFASLTTQFGAFDISNIDAISMVLAFNTGGSLTLGEIRIVPEPASAALCLLSVPFFLRRKRSRE